MAILPKLSLLSGKLSTGQILLGAYIAAVIVVAVVRDTVGKSVVVQLASTPAALAHGAWWQLFTSGLVVDGPFLPQVLAVGVLGALGIYFRGSLLFWLTALAGHIFGTIITYLGVGAAWLVNPNWVAGLFQQEDYGISLIWCAALGMVTAAAWLGPDSSHRHFFKPVVALLAVVIMVVVTWYSVGLARYEHLAAFGLAFFIVSVTSQHRHISKRLERRRQTRRHAAVRTA